jgi:hypothetical protein
MQPKGDSMNIITKIKLVLTQPTKFFTKIKKERGIYPPFKYLAILALFSTIMGFIKISFFRPLNFIQNFLKLNIPPVATTLPSNLLFSLWGYIITMVSVFVIVAILFVWIKIFKGKANYEKTYQIYVYGTTPSFLFNWIPILGGFAWIYDLILLIIGTSIIHKVSKTRATIIYLIPLALFIILTIIAMIGLILLLSSSPELVNKLNINI